MRYDRFALPRHSGRISHLSVTELVPNCNLTILRSGVRLRGPFEMSERKASILVTGGAGYIGSHTVLALLDAGYVVVVLDDLTNGERWSVDRRATFFEGRIENQSLVRAIMPLHNVKAVIHFAGAIPGQESSADPLRFYRNNTSASQSLIESAINCGIGHFVYASSAEVYGDQQNGPILEGGELRPSSAYARSKLMTETILADIARAHSMNFCTLRFFNVAGSDPAWRCGGSKVGVPHLIRQALEAVMGWRAQVVIHGTDFDTPDGTAIRDYVHVNDVALAHVAALKAIMASPGCNMQLNCGYGSGHSALEILAAVERITNVRIARGVAPRRADSPAVLVTDCAAIREALDWKPLYSDIEQIIRGAYRWEAQMIQQRASNFGSDALLIGTTGGPRSRGMELGSDR